MQRLKELDHRIVSEFVLGNGCYERLVELCALGTRFAGTLGEKLAQDYIVKQLSSYGLRTEIEPFEHLAWKRGTASLEIVDPVKRELVAVSLAGGPSTPEGGLECEVLSVGDGTPQEFEQYQGQIEDRIVFTTSFAPKTACMPPRQCHRRTKYGRAVANGAKAFLFMNSQPGMLPQTGSTKQNEPGEIPAVTLPYEEGEVLRYHLRRGPVRVKLSIQNESFKHQTGNIVAEITGQNPDEIVIIGGHYDCHDNSHGALDNGAGVAMLLEMARILSQSGVQFRKTIRFVFFAVEEMACVGSSFYVLRHREELDRIHLFMNIDGVGHPGGKTFDTQGFADLTQYIYGVSQDMGYDFPLPSPAFSGDSVSFVVGGVPTAALKSSRTPGMFNYVGKIETGEDRGWGHTPADTIDKIKPSDLYEGSIIAGRTLIRAASHVGPIARYRNDDEVAAVLNHHGMAEVLSLMGWPTIPIGTKYSAAK
ncbi:MAG: M20/M25/M40 family metallo-hydrolase [Bacillota bacterium]|nr:M20/M25/M40 family metallo-hydrolase [Bacillota bacterium]